MAGTPYLEIYYACFPMNGHGFFHPMDLLDIHVIALKGTAFPL